MPVGLCVSHRAMDVPQSPAPHMGTIVLESSAYPMEPYLSHEAVDVPWVPYEVIHVHG